MHKLKNIFRISIFRMTGMMFFLTINASPINALDWNDKNWGKSGCPKTILGSWVSRSSEESLMIEANRLIFQAIDEDQQFYSYKQSISSEKNKHIEIILSSKNSTDENKRYLKIRPHIAQSITHEEKTQVKTATCLIKVFQFENQKDAKLNKYMSWDIYKRK